MPTGRVKWYEEERGFGFITSDEGDDVFLHASVLPSGTTTIKNGTKVQFGVADGKRGKQAMHLTIVDEPPFVAGARPGGKGRGPHGGKGKSVAKERLMAPDALAKVLFDLIPLLEDAKALLEDKKSPGEEGYVAGRYPSDEKSAMLAMMLRKVADGFDV